MPEARADPWARPLVDFWLPALMLGGLTLLFFLVPIDLEVEDWFYSPEQGGWFLKDAEPLQQIYKKGLVPALVVTVAAIVLLLAGLGSVGLRRYRKVAIYLLLVMVIAPGLLVNALMKEGWGRPRPRQVEQFGGQESYERVWEYDGSSYGKSFPSGHAAMGFYFFGLYFLMRREGRAAICLWLAISLGLGLLLGLTRMAQGGHFPSDVLWSAGVCYFVAAAIYYAMGLHRDLWFRGGSLSRSAIIGCGIALLGVGLLAVGTPYHEEKHFSPRPESLAGATGLDLKLELPRANLRLSAGDRFLLEAEAEGFGSPGSRLEDRFETTRVGGICEIKLKQKKSGFFATVEQPMSVEIPFGLAFEGEVIVGEGVVTIDLEGAGSTPWEVDLELGDADLNIVVPDGLEFKVELADGVSAELGQSLEGIDWDAEKRRFKRGEAPSVKLRVRAGSRGGISFQAAGGPSD